jgi:hypothetical protein
MRALFFGVKSVRANAREKSIVNGYVKTQLPNSVSEKVMPFAPRSVILP